MNKEITISVPKNWKGVTLRQYLEMQKDLESYSDNEEALNVLIIKHLCGIPVDLVTKIDVDTFAKIKSDLSSFLADVEHPLQRIIKIGEVEYGFEPDLSNMAYGAYVDISKYNELKISDKWAEIMSILYRPVTKKNGQYYNIETYKGTNRSELFMDVPMDVHFGALFFFKGLLKDLLKDIQKSLTDLEGLPPNIRSILEQSGAHISRLFN